MNPVKNSVQRSCGLVSDVDDTLVFVPKDQYAITGLRSDCLSPEHFNDERYSVHAYPNVKETLKYCKEKGISLYTISGVRNASTEAKMRSADLSDFFCKDQHFFSSNKGEKLIEIIGNTKDKTFIFTEDNIDNLKSVDAAATKHRDNLKEKNVSVEIYLLVSEQRLEHENYTKEEVLTAIEQDIKNNPDIRVVYDWAEIRQRFMDILKEYDAAP